MKTEEFEKYQVFTEKTINNLSQKVTLLEKKLDMFAYLLEISKYINQYIKDPNLFPLINDMLIGVFGAKYSTIYIKLNDEDYDPVAQDRSPEFLKQEKELVIKHQEEEFIINSNQPIYAVPSGESSIHSCLGVPIKVENRLIGFILIQHTEVNYFTKEHAVFLSLIGNHIGVAIENNFLYKQIRDSANRDGLTELYNKRYFFDTLNHIPNLAEQKFSIVIMDLDDFKQINDNFGHPFGDAALKTVANIIKKATRSNDIVARYGGDEIIMYMSNFTDIEKVRQRIEGIRKEIEQTVINMEGITFGVTVSIGVYCKCDEHLSLNEVIKNADDIMYQSKKGGKNKVTIY